MKTKTSGFKKKGNFYTLVTATCLLTVLFFLYSCNNDKRSYKKIIVLNDIEDLQTFLNMYPSSEFAEDVQFRILKALIGKNSVDSIDKFIHDYPSGKHRNIALQVRDTLISAKSNAGKALQINAYWNDQRIASEEDIYKSAVKILEDHLAGGMLLEQTAKSYNALAGLSASFGDEIQKGFYKRAGYSYYMASMIMHKAKQKITAEAMRRSMEAKEFLSSEEMNFLDVIDNEYPGNIIILNFYKKSAQNFRKAGLTELADEIENSNKIVTCNFPEIEREWNFK